MSSVLASARLPVLMKFDLAGPRCVKEYDYCQRLAGLGQMSAEEGPQDVSIPLMLLKKPVLRVRANGLAREGARTSDRDFGLPLEWNATTRTTLHLAEVMVGWNHPEAHVNVARRGQFRRVYVVLLLFWEDGEVRFALGAETPPVCAYLGFRMIFEGPDDSRWWIVWYNDIHVFAFHVHVRHHDYETDPIPRVQRTLPRTPTANGYGY